MNTFEIRNDATGEVVDTADTYTEALGKASYLTHTTKVLHFVPVRVGTALEMA